ncbi:MAG: hypothetical protein LW884_10910, partial [Bacteroidetes bacterium]|nr:hypothetical protein [Bacteroidota bacterium]
MRNTQSGWLQVQYDLCPLSGNSCVQFRLTTDLVDAGCTPAHFAIDNFRIGDPKAFTVGIVNFNRPFRFGQASTECADLGAAEPVTIMLENTACRPVVNLPVALSVSRAGAGVVGTSSGTVTVPKQGRAYLTFPDNINLDTPGDYTLTATLTPQPGDNNATDDVLTWTVRTSQTPVTVASSYLADFNSGNQGFVPTANSSFGFQNNRTNFWRQGPLPAGYAAYNGGTPADPSDDVDATHGEAWYLEVNGRDPDPNLWTDSYYRNFELYTPIFDLSQINQPTISFDFKMNMLGQSGVTVQYRYTDATGTQGWTNLGTNAAASFYGLAPSAWNSPGFGTPTGSSGTQFRTTRSDWQQASYTGTELCQASGRGCVQFRFVVDMISTVIPQHFAIDNFRIGGARPYNIAIENITGPTNGRCAGLGAAEQITVMLRNEACMSILNLPISVQVDGPGGSSQTLNGTIASLPVANDPNFIFYYTLPGTANMSTDGEYTLTARITAPAGELNAALNDGDNTLVQNRQTQPIDLNLGNFVADFENDAQRNDFFVAIRPTGTDPNANYWKNGTLPAGYAGFANGAGNVDASEGRAWYLLYRRNGDVQLETPSFNFSNLPANSNMMLEFDLKLSAAEAKRMVVQYQRNDDGTWRTLGGNDPAYPDFYTKAQYFNGNTGTFIAAFGGSQFSNVPRVVPGWLHVSYPVCRDVGNAACVKFRFEVSQGSGANPQFAIDNFTIRNVGPDVSPTAVVSPAPGNAGSCAYGPNTPLVVRVFNRSCQTLTADVPIQAVVDGPGPQQTYSVTMPNDIAPSGTVDFQIGTVDLSRVGTYSIRINTNLNTDPIRGNDTVRSSITVRVPNIALSGGPYEEDFEDA